MHNLTSTVFFKRTLSFLSNIKIRKISFLSLLLCSTALGTFAQTYTPGSYNVTVPAGTSTMVVTVTGAAGGTDAGAGGNGGSVTATYNVTPGTIYYIYVGSKAANGAGTGGGSSWGGGEDGGGGGSTGPADGGGGGAASDIRTTSGVLSSRIVVGGGGGGGMGHGCTGTAAGGNGGYAAGTTGGAGGSGCGCSTAGGGGGTQTAGGPRGGSTSCSDAAPGSLGAGGGSTSGTGGGGGGYYGGGAAYNGGGGGGSSYASATSLVGSATFSNGTNTGDGSVTICFSTGAITGPTSVCPGGTINLSDATPSGTWSSSNTSIATINSSGVVYGITGGTTNISYSAGSCPAVLTVTVTALPAITGPTTVCAGSQIHLSDATSGGLWSSSNSTAATISGSGVVSGSSAGTTNISYTVGSCAVGVAITVSGSISAITAGATTVCAGSTIYLSDASPGGAWTSSNTTIATVSGGTVTGASGGTTNISYTVGACAVGIAITVNSVAAITGPTTLCGGTIALSDATAGGVWSSSNTAAATISGTGVVYGVAPGTTNISYTVGSCAVGYVVTVTGSLAPITGTTTVCVGSATNLSDATAGGVWSSSNTAIATVVGGVVTGAAAGTANISYTVGSCAVGIAVTVSGALSAITGPTTVCPGGTINLSDATAGGVWSSNNTAIATVSGSVIVTGVAAGTVNISYTVGSCSVGRTITVGPLSGITGITNVCPGSTTHLSDATPGGVWSSSNTSVATISGTGIVSGITTGTTNISYTIGSCSTGIVVNVAALSPITGATTLCGGSTTSLSDATTGGVWSSGNTTIATVVGGVVTGAATGTTTIVYTLGSCSVSATVTVSGTLSPITGNPALCPGSTSNLSDATPGGVWSSNNTAVATVSGAGIAYGASAGTANISYTTGSCSVEITVTVTVIAPITGPTSMCVSSSISLSDATPGGVWSMSNTTIATVSGTGVVTGITSGGATVSYTVGACAVGYPITVGNNISPISGTNKVCLGSTLHLSDPTPGGAWSSTTTTVATVTGAGIVSGVSLGTSIISYTVGGCPATSTVTVVPNNAGTITGSNIVCIGPTPTYLSDAQSGGIWTSSPVSRATVNSTTGVVTGISTGLVTITYTITNACGTFSTTYTVHVYTAAQCLAGITPVAEGQNTELKVFPNPNSGTFTMKLLSDIDEEVHVVISNIVGQKVREFITTTNNIVNIKLEPAAGIYLLSATTSHGKYISKVEVN